MFRNLLYFIFAYALYLTLSDVYHYYQEQLAAQHHMNTHHGGAYSEYGILDEADSNSGKQPLLASNQGASKETVGYPASSNGVVTKPVAQNTSNKNASYNNQKAGRINIAESMKITVAQVESE